MQSIMQLRGKVELERQDHPIGPHQYPGRDPDVGFEKMDGWKGKSFGRSGMQVCKSEERMPSE